MILIYGSEQTMPTERPKSTSRTHLTTGQRGRTGKLMSQSGALKHAKRPVLLLRTSVKANRENRNPGANTKPSVR